MGAVSGYSPKEKLEVVRAAAVEVNQQFYGSLGMDEPDEEEDICIDIDGVPFVAARDFLDKYGKRFSLGYNANREVLLEALDA